MFIEDLNEALLSQADAYNAFHMKAYMRNKFEFFGIKATERRQILSGTIARNKEEIEHEYRSIVRALYALPQRELHLCAMEVFFRFGKKGFQNNDMKLIEFLIITNSWWDTVDYIAKNILGTYLKQYPDQVEKVIQRFSSEENIWLNRSTILFQLGYKADTNTDLLFAQCERFRGSSEFFIQKAIGWALREYAKIDPEAVLNFVNSHKLKPLSRREAIRNII